MRLGGGSNVGARGGGGRAGGCRIHDNISCMWLGRGSNAKTAREGKVLPTIRPTDRHGASSMNVKCFPFFDILIGSAPKTKAKSEKLPLCLKLH